MRVFQEQMYIMPILLTIQQKKKCRKTKAETEPMSIRPKESVALVMGWGRGSFGIRLKLRCPLVLWNYLFKFGQISLMVEENELADKGDVLT